MTDFQCTREKLIDVREERRGASRFEVREDKKNSQVVLEGYAATYEPYDVHGGPLAGGWVEQLRGSAFDATLATQPDVQLLINHEGTPLARTKSGTLQLSRDRNGLRVRAFLDPTDPDVQRLLPKMRRGDMDEMSFAFRVKDQTWDSSYTHRTINDLSLEKGDVSVVNYGMNPGTRAILSAEAVGTLAQLSNADLVELRKAGVQLDAGQVKRAKAALQAIESRATSNGNGSKKDGSKDSSKPYGSVPYADPGYKSDGRKRYPIDTEEHARAAWSYINMPKNQKGYTSTQVSSIKNRIKTALKKFGVNVSDSEKKFADLSYIDMQRNLDGGTTLVAVMSDGTRVPLPSQRATAGLLAMGSAPTAADRRTKAPMPNQEFDPQDLPLDPHEDPFNVNPAYPKKPGDFGPVPDNIQGGGLAAKPGEFVDPGKQEDPHEEDLDHVETYGYDAEEDPHETPYTGGPQVGSVPGDRPNYGPDFPNKGPTPPNIIGGTLPPPQTPAPAAAKDPTAEGVTPEYYSLPSGNGLVRSEGLYDWTSGPIGQPDDPEENLDAPVPGRPTSPDEPGLSDTRDDDDDDVDDEKFDLGMAQALDRTIVHAYKLAQGNAQVRKALTVARNQLNALRGAKQQPAQRGARGGVTDRLMELRKAQGLPDAATVTDGLNYLRNTAYSPVGYGGILRHDPSAHVVSASERLAREVLDKDRRATKAAEDVAQAREKLKQAQREAEINGMIRRRKQLL